MKLRPHFAFAQRKATSWGGAAGACGEAVTLSAVALFILRTAGGALTCLQGSVPVEPEARQDLVAPRMLVGLAPHRACWCLAGHHCSCVQPLTCSTSRCSSEGGRRGPLLDGLVAERRKGLLPKVSTAELRRLLLIEATTPCCCCSRCCCSQQGSLQQCSEEGLLGPGTFSCGVWPGEGVKGEAWVSRPWMPCSPSSPASPFSHKVSLLSTRELLFYMQSMHFGGLSSYHHQDLLEW